MPRAKRNSGGSGQLPQFVSCRLSEEELAHCQARPLTDPEITDFIVKIVEAGHKISFGWDSWNDAVIATVTRPNEDKSKAGVALSARGPDFHGAVTVAAFKFYEKLGSDLDNAQVEVSKQQWG